MLLEKIQLEDAQTVTNEPLERHVMLLEKIHLEQVRSVTDKPLEMAVGGWTLSGIGRITHNAEIRLG